MDTRPHHAIIGRALRVFSAVTSTNTIAVQMAQEGAAEGLCIIADEQTGGRGRFGRTWTSPPGVNLYLSVILRPSINTSEAPRMTIMSGVAVADALSRFCPGDISIKWPNDILLKGKKVAGILTEMKAKEECAVDFIVVGIGININCDGDCLGPEVRHRAISLKDILGHDISRIEVANEVIRSFDIWYSELIRSGFEKIRETWCNNCMMMGKEVEVLNGTVNVTGIAEDIDMIGALIINDKTDRRRHVISGDIVVTGE